MPLNDVITPLLGRLRVRYLQSPLPGFFDWWFGQLRDCLPSRWQRLFANPDQQLLFSLVDQRLQLRRVTASRSETLADLELAELQAEPEPLRRLLADLPAHEPRFLLLPGDQVLRRRLSLPAAAAANARTMAAFEIDRQTPFKPDQVEFDCRLLPAAASGKSLAVELAVVPRERVLGQLERLGALAGELDGVDGEFGGRRGGFNFLPEARRRRRDHRPLLINLGLLALAALFLLLAMAQVVANREAAVVSLRAEVETQRAAARGTAQLRGSLDDAVKAASFLAEQRQQRPSMLELLRLLTEVLPDDTYVERMSYVGEQVSVSVQSGAAAQLVERLQAAQLLSNPALVGAIQPDPRTAKDRATFSARLLRPNEVSP